MKKLALLLFVLPLAACTTGQQVEQLRSSQFADAKEACTAGDNGPSDQSYWRCVNAHLIEHGWQAKPEADGSLHVVIMPGPYQAGYF